MAELTTIPNVVNVRHYGGDTLYIYVKAPPELTDAKEWSAQVRANRLATVVDATFTITPSAGAGLPTTLMLPAAVVRDLLDDATQIRVKDSAGQYAMVMRYQGVWDVQIAAAGGTDPVQTLAQGTLTIDLDVTREAAA